MNSSRTDGTLDLYNKVFDANKRNIEKMAQGVNNYPGLTPEEKTAEYLRQALLHFKCMKITVRTVIRYLEAERLATEAAGQVPNLNSEQ